LIKEIGKNPHFAFLTTLDIEAIAIDVSRIMQDLEKNGCHSNHFQQYVVITFGPTNQPGALAFTSFLDMEMCIHGLLILSTPLKELEPPTVPRITTKYLSINEVSEVHEVPKK
jgi:hypothetical protein